MEEQKDNTKKYLVIAVITLLIAIGLILFFNSVNTSELEGKNKLLQDSANQDKELIDAYREQKKITDNEVDSLMTIISENEEAKVNNQVNNWKHEKIRTINLYTTSEQQAYFDSVAADYIRKAKRSSNLR